METVTVDDVPGGPAGAVAVRMFGVTTVTFVAAVLPNMTDVPVTNPAPEMTTFDPPEALPTPGDTAVTSGFSAPDCVTVSVIGPKSPE